MLGGPESAVCMKDKKSQLRSYGCVEQYGAIFMWLISERQWTYFLAVKLCMLLLLHFH